MDKAKSVGAKTCKICFEIFEFKNQLETSIYLNITRERVRQILKLGSKKFEIKYKYPELQ